MNLLSNYSKNMKYRCYRILKAVIIAANLTKERMETVTVMIAMTLMGKQHT